MKKVKTVYICDVCKKEFDNDILKPIQIPAKISDSEGRTYRDSFMKVDLCEECTNKFSKIVYKHFGVLYDTLGGLSFKEAENN